jgi:ComF family protein
MFTSWPNIRRALGQTALEQDCVLCRAPSRDALFCAGCDADLPQLANACPQCAGPSSGSAVCGACLANAPSFDATIAVWRYAFPVDRLMLALKYGNRLALAAAFGDALAETVAARQVDAIAPMPLSARRLKERGYNQAMEIARRLGRRTGIRLDAALARRVRDTMPQTDLPHDAREANVRGAFACDKRGAGMTLAIVDDVMTTGATLEELARTLKRAGVQRVENWAVARTWPKQ